MTGLQRIQNVLCSQPTDRPPALPIIHSALAGIENVPLGQFYSRADMMADVLLAGWRRFGYDGIQLSQGVTAEAEALGAPVDQGDDAPPTLTGHRLSDTLCPDALRAIDPTTAGRMPLLYEAIERLMQAVGREAFILPTLRGPMLLATQLRGIERLMMDMLDAPDAVGGLLDFCTDVALRLARPLVCLCDHGLLLGEAPCSPDMISPAMYRQLILPRHRRLIEGLHTMGFGGVGLHICGDIRAIFEDIIASGADFCDIDHKVSADDAIRLAGGRIAMRGNLDPSGTFRFGPAEQVTAQTAALRQTVAGHRWMLSSGCDIPPGTPEANLAAFTAAARD
jgi:uroporphyrinogen decarboxylase